MKAVLTNRRSEDVIVTDISSLQQLSAGPLRLWWRSQILLHVEGLTAAETESWRRRLNAHYSACGCKAGAIVMAIAIESYVLFLSVGTNGVSEWTWLHLVAGGVIGLLGAFVGKILGLGWARYRLKKTVEELSLRLTVGPAHVGPDTH